MGWGGGGEGDINMVTEWCYAKKHLTLVSCLYIFMQFSG